MPRVSSKSKGGISTAQIALALSIIAIIMSAYSILYPHIKTDYIYNSTNGTRLLGYNITSVLITPQTSLSDAPVVTQNQSFGKRLTGINLAFNSSELSAINNAPNSYF